MILYDFVKPLLLESRTDIDHRETNFLTRTRGDHYLNAKSKQAMIMLGDQFPRKNSRQHNSIYNIYWLLTDTIQVRTITNSIVPFQFGSALY